MKKTVLSLLLVIGSLYTSFSQSQFIMDNIRLGEQLAIHSDTIVGDNGRWQLLFKEVPMMVVTAPDADRMRIIAPITDASTLDEALLLDCMTANFHSALDVKYAISDGVLWSAYIHPLSPLTDEQVASALSQVYSAVVTYGTTFSSTELIFGGNTGTTEEQEEEKPDIKLKKT